MNDTLTPQFWVSASTLLWNILLGFYVWSVTREQATRTEIKAVRDDLQAMKDNQALSCGNHHARTTTLEERVKNAPTHNDLGAVYDRINMVKGGVDEMSGMLKFVSTQVGLLVKHHMHEGKNS